MHNAVIEKSLYEDVVAFCEVNEITDVNQFINETLKKGFDMKKYGDSFAFFFNRSEDDIIHVKNGVKEPEPEVAVIPEVVIEPEVEAPVATKKRGGRKKKEEPKVEEIVPEVVEEVVVEEIEQPNEPVYKIKEEEIKKPEKKYVSLRSKKDDNYDVYDEI
jgi:hypothetical protein